MRATSTLPRSFDVAFRRRRSTRNTDAVHFDFSLIALIGIILLIGIVKE